MMTYALHLGPKQDLMKALNAFVREKQLKASYIFTCAGSLSSAVLSPANRARPARYKGYFEIVALVGTLSPSSVNLELSIADEYGNTFNGRLMPGCAISSDVEIVLSELSGLFSDQLVIPRTGFDAFRFVEGAD